LASENVSLALLHGSVLDRKGRVSVTSVANMDIHDVARSARTFGIRRFYIVTPLAKQQTLVRKIIGHWQEGYGAMHNPSRREAFSLVDLKGTLDEVIDDVACRSGKRPRMVVTGARLAGPLISPSALRDEFKSGDPHLLVFGTGWGLAEEVLARADIQMEPIRGMGEYNHLSVRSAVAIVLDRLWGRENCVQ